MKYYIAFNQPEFQGNVIVYGANPDNESGFVSRCNQTISELTFDNFASFKKKLKEFGFEIQLDPAAEFINPESASE